MSRRPPAAAEPGPSAVGTRRSIVIERVEPEVDGGRYPVKRVVGDELGVTADIFAEGHDRLAAALLVRAEGASRWTESPMRLIDNDRWSGTAPLSAIGRHRFTIEAWVDAVASWQAPLQAKLAARQPIDIELAEGRLLLAAAAARASGDDRRLLERAVADAERSEGKALLTILSDPDALAAARRHPDRSAATRYFVEVPVMVDRERARAGAWYELFPRSQGTDPRRPTATTLREAAWRLPEIAAMGFDVVYLPPIHPIGHTNRKGRNNTLRASADDPGSPWAIGSEAGGHEAVAPELGGLEAFQDFRAAAADHGLEIALDLALQASPDHPWVRAHPEWFRRAPDGSIRFAENPPKRYEDIYPFDFSAGTPAQRAALWQAWLEIVQLWIARGVRIFRVDNPHTKPLPFWVWLIGEVVTRHPDVIFLSEAFTRPKRMWALGKAGFTQSYTYFTWRTTADELRTYLRELTDSPLRESMRPNFFVNTPDIFPHELDLGRPMFEVRAVLAALLSPSWGLYSGFELCEQARLANREEYAHSEKYEIRARDWDAPGNIKPLIRALNELRQAHPAFRRSDGLRFEPVTGSRTLFFRQALPDGPLDPLGGYPSRWRDAVYVAVNCEPAKAERAVLHPDLPAIGIGWDEPYQLRDLLTGRTRRARGADLRVRLDAERPYRIFAIQPLPR